MGQGYAECVEEEGMEYRRLSELVSDERGVEQYCLSVCYPRPPRSDFVHTSMTSDIHKSGSVSAACSPPGAIGTLPTHAKGN